MTEVTLEEFNELKKKFDWIYAKTIEQQDSLDEERLLDAARVSNINRVRNTYVFSGSDSLDATYPFELDFEIVSEMVAIENVKLSFKIGNFRAYSKGAASGGGATSGSGGAQEKTSSSGGGGTSGASSPGVNLSGWTENAGDQLEDGYLVTSTVTHTHSVGNHTHTVNIDNHTHTVPAHTHDLTFGIYEDSQSPTISIYIDNGYGYGDSIGEYTANRMEIDLTKYISGIGFKRIKFESTTRARISAWIMCKVDVRP